MGVRGPEMGGPPMLKSVEKSSGPGREGHHILGQSLRKVFPLFATPFGISTPQSHFKITVPPGVTAGQTIQVQIRDQNNRQGYLLARQLINSEMILQEVNDNQSRSL